MNNHMGPSQPAETADGPEQNTIVVENEALRRGFTLIPNDVLRDSEISFGARLTYTLLLSYAWQEGSCFPGQERMADDLGVTRQAVNKYLKELKADRYVSWKRRGLGRTNIYYILDRSKSSAPAADQKEGSPQTAPSNGPAPDVTTRLHQNVTAGFHQDVNPRLHNKDTEEEDTEQQPVVARKLTGLNVSPDKVKEILAGYPSQYIEQKLELLRWKRKHSLRHRPISDPAGWLVKAIENDYQPPREFTVWQTRRQRRHQRSHKIEEWDKERQEEAERKKAEAQERYAEAIAALKSEYETCAEDEKHWQQALALIRDFTGAATYRFWFPDTHLLAIRDGTIFVAVPNGLTKRRIEGKYAATVVRTLSAVVDLKGDPNVAAVVPPHS